MQSASTKIHTSSNPRPAKKLIKEFSGSLLILLWTYTALSKLSDIPAFWIQLRNQVFAPSTALVLLWAIPATELLAAALLLLRRTNRAGFAISTLLMLAFTSYIALVLLGHYPKTPCSCGGVLKQLSWQAHFWFNLFFLVLAVCGLLSSRPVMTSQLPTRQSPTALPPPLRTYSVGPFQRKKPTGAQPTKVAQINNH